MWFRRKEDPWEVVDSKVIEPVPMYDDDDDIEILRVGESELSRVVTFDMKKTSQQPDIVGAVDYARSRVLRDAAKRGYNVLLCEGLSARWQLTLLRKGKWHRVEVHYVGRPAAVKGNVPELPPPPFVNMLQALQAQVGRELAKLAPDNPAPTLRSRAKRLSVLSKIRV
ncbi:hypothetical protein B0H21DRAFT_314401 [Amylocystis lapponica]|nr:hypothetical protein B0H21DRAFT_314401 [Amylocystis lapponica]